MDDGLGILIAVLVGVFLAFTGIIIGANLVRDEAIAANVACYKVVGNSGRTEFTWNCKQPQ